MASGTQVIPFDRGWAWYAQRDQQALLQLFVDSSVIPARDRLPAFIGECASALGPLRPALPADLAGYTVHARYAQPRYNPHPIDAKRHWAAVGDAAFAPDPLSGHGLFTALGGALSLAAVIHTIEQQPANSSLAVDFYQERMHDDFYRLARIGRDFYRLEKRWETLPFWHERSQWPDAQPAHAPLASGELRIAERPVNDQGLIVARAVVISADQPRGIWQVAGVPVAPLLNAWRADSRLDLQHYAQTEGLSFKACQAAWAWLQQRRLR